MRSVCGTIAAVQEARFRLLADAGRSVLFVLSVAAKIEPQALGRLGADAARVRVAYCESRRLIAAVAHGLEIEELGP